jgi:hypothetical protein
MSTVDPRSTIGIASFDVSSLDLESALMAVQTQRANLLEAQLKEQISAVQAKNEQISRLNQLLGTLNKAAASVPADAKAGDKVKLSPEDAAAIKAAADTAGITLPKEMRPPDMPYIVTLKDGTQIPVDAAGKKQAEDYRSRNWAFRSNDYSGRKAVVSIKDNLPSPNKGQLDGFVQTVKSQIDSLSNTQQMDMLRLQSLTNKRNEAFETMTNFIKKMQDSRSAIVSNMR